MGDAAITGDTVFLVFGALGDLAKKAILPNLYILFSKGLLPSRTKIFGLDVPASSPLALAKFREQMFGLLPLSAGPEEDELREQFKEEICSYIGGDWGREHSGAWEELERGLEDWAGRGGKGKGVNRVSYLAIPPHHFTSTAHNLRTLAYSSSPSAINRICVEKPLGRDSKSFEVLLANLAKSGWDLEKEVYLVDHLLAESWVIGGVLQARFANGWVTDEMMSRKCVKSVVVECYESSGAEGRGGYFDHYGLIRDVCQNHIFQLLTYFLIDPPLSLSAFDLIAAKVALLKSIPPLLPEHTLLGQYTASTTDPNKKAYTDDETVMDKGTRAETFAETVFWIENERWEGVPCVMRCGKAMDKGGLRLTYNFLPPPTSSLFPDAAPTALTISFSRDGPTISLGTNFLSTPTTPTSPSLPSDLAPPISDPTTSAPLPNTATPLPPSVATVSSPSATSPIQGLARPQTNGVASYTLPPPPSSPSSSKPGFGAGHFAVYERLWGAVLQGDRTVFASVEEVREAWRVFSPLLAWKDGKDGPMPVGYEYGGSGPEGQGRWE